MKSAYKRIKQITSDNKTENIILNKLSYDVILSVKINKLSYVM